MLRLDGLRRGEFAVRGFATGSDLRTLVLATNAGRFYAVDASTHTVVGRWDARLGDVHDVQVALNGTVVALECSPAARGPPTMHLTWCAPHAHVASRPAVAYHAVDVHATFAHVAIQLHEVAWRGRGSCRS
jgi:hypothetical protein